MDRFNAHGMRLTISAPSGAFLEPGALVPRFGERHLAFDSVLLLADRFSPLPQRKRNASDRSLQSERLERGRDSIVVQPPGEFSSPSGVVRSLNSERNAL